MAGHPGPVGVPVISGAGQPLHFHLWTPETPLVDGPFGARVPAEGVAMVPRVVIVPMLAFDARGYRLGYGGGFYDRTLAALEPRPHTVGLGFTQGFVDDFEPEPHDQPLDAILNDNGVVWPVAAP